MSLAIVSDSNVSVPPSLIAGLPLHVVPLEIHHRGRVYRDGVDLTPSEFYALQRTAPTPPTTSAPRPGAFIEAFTQAARDASEVLCLTLSSKLSATHEVALAAQREAVASLPDTRINVVDSRSAAAAQGLVVLEAARMASSGATADQVLREVDGWIGAVHLYGYLDSLYYVWRGGRLPRVLMWMGKLLDVKPVLRLSDGQIGMVERPRTERRAIERVVALAASKAAGGPTRVAVIHADAPGRAEELAERLVKAIAPTELFITELTPVIGAHTGPRLVGCALHVLPHDC